MRPLLRLGWSVVFMAAVHPAAAGILAQAVPVKFNLTARPGQSLGRDVAVRNLGDAAVVVHVRLSDWQMSERGELDLVPAGSTSATLAGWVEFEPSQFSLLPGEAGVVHVTLRMPGEGPATRFGVLLSEVRPAQWPNTSFGPRAVAEIGTTLYLSRVPDGSTRAELRGLDVRAAGDSGMAVLLRVGNPGERHLYATGEVAVRDSSGAILSHGNLATGVVLPGANRIFTWTCASRLPPGRYSITATLDTGEPELIVGETEVRWPLSPARAIVSRR
jgi:hypothetical protein